MNFKYGWPARWRRPASIMSRMLRQYILSWMTKKRERIAQAPKVTDIIPVVCIGNLVVGGSGKSPLVADVAERLLKEGFHPGIVSRGYGGKVKDLPIEVSDDSLATNVGDEPLMLKKRLGCPVVVCRNRARAVARLIFHHSVDVVLSDDGLQNSSLWRDVSVCVFNKDQGIGNGLELPFGPLREPLIMLEHMDAIVITGTDYPKEMLQDMGIETAVPVFGSVSRLAYAYRSDDPEIRISLHTLPSYGEFNAVAGIATPARFFDGLDQAGLLITRHAYPDHHRYVKDDLKGIVNLITTEKDAVKLLQVVTEAFWVVVLESQQAEFENWLITRLKEWGIK
ncbi:tetraacyldisaccharide 4'-kinase [Litorivicinus sp.]|jgi:tetraacyldisaccharide 4'-kinase|nr:tetraacyldisaccharide 4'-kinase [Litorivicinus sp.]MDC1240047.1 tetraacyldisaccharide 4'-kinase [Litorivicinus sp.]